MLVDQLTTHITVTTPSKPLFAGEDEVWIEATGPDPLPGYDDIRRAAEAQTGMKLALLPVRYYPSWGGPNEPYTELWVTKKRIVFT